MSTSLVSPEPNMMVPPMPSKPQGQDPTPDDPNGATPEQNQQAVELTEEEKGALLQLRRDYKLSWAPNRRALVKNTLRAIETAKGNANQYQAFDPENFSFYDPIADALAGGNSAEDVELYRYNNNIYQMLMRSFMAALSPQVPKTRYRPEDADSEIDLATARRASSMMALIEQANDIEALLQQELMHLWTGGCYFSYTRYVVDGDAFKYKQVPVIEMQEQQVLPDRYVCGKCGAVTPADELSVWTQAQCPQCQAPLTDADFYPSEAMPMPTEVGKQDLPNGGVKINVYGLINVDAAPYAQDLSETPILDLEVETDIGAIRANYPEAWKKLGNSQGVGGTPEGEADRLARLQSAGAPGGRSGYLNGTLTTYSRCWIQPWAFNKLEDRKMAEGLKAKFPQGCKLVTSGQNQFLEAIDEKLTDHWTNGKTLPSLGLYPPPVGGSALDIQTRINDVANIVHEHMDRNASPTVLFNADLVDGEAMSGKSMMPGTLTPIKFKQALVNRTLNDVFYQPQFHVDGNIYNYSENLIMLAQLVSGVLPQIFGGSDPNVKTAQGQNQMLNTALGQLALYWKNIRSEHSQRAENAVKCFARNMTEDIRHVIEGDTDSGFENEYILLSEMQGSFHAYPESDQGFPATFGEMRDRMMDLLNNIDKNPFVTELLQDPDNAKVIARYVLPDEIKILGDAERTKIKRIIGQLAKSQPLPTMDEMTGQPVLMPQTEEGIETPDPDFDDMGMIVEIGKAWAQRNFRMKVENPGGYENVRAYVRLAAQYQAKAAIKQQMAQAAAAGAGAPEEAAQGEQA